MQIDITCFAHRLIEKPDQTWLRIHIIQPKGNIMAVRRLYRSGNSWVITLSADQLNHMGIQPGGYIRVEIAARKRLRLQKAPEKIQLPHPIN
jgi:antitoxin component of MazEF toxin-antitoxin module